MIWRVLPSLGPARNPFEEFARLQGEVNSLFNGFRGRSYEFPPVNVWANEDEVVVTAEVPGINPQDIKVTVTGNTLTLEGERTPPELKEDEVFHRQERGTGHFVRSVRLPFEVESEHITARARDGILSVSLPRSEAAKPRRIAIRAEA